MILFYKRVLFEWIRARKKEQAYAETVSLKAIAACAANLLIIKDCPLFFLNEPLTTSSRDLKKDYPSSDFLEKHPEGSIKVSH